MYFYETGLSICALHCLWFPADSQISILFFPTMVPFLNIFIVLATEGNERKFGWAGRNLNQEPSFKDLTIANATYNCVTMRLTFTINLVPGGKSYHKQGSDVPTVQLLGSHPKEARRTQPSFLHSSSPMLRGINDKSYVLPTAVMRRRRLPVLLDIELLGAVAAITLN